MKTIIKASSHTTKFANYGKNNTLIEFLTEYHRVYKLLLDMIWDMRIEWGRGRIFDTKNNKIDIPTFMSTTSFNIDTPLSARAIKIISGEVLALIKSRTAKRKKQQYQLAEMMRDGNGLNAKHLQSKIDSNPITKPSAPNSLVAKLDSNCCQFIDIKTPEFDGFLKISSIGKKYGAIYIPIKYTKHSNKLAKKGYNRMTTWQISPTDVKSIWEMEIPVNTGTEVVGADQGYVTCLTLSDGQVTNKCAHGHDLYSIIEKMKRQKKGSKAFKRTQAHRTNYINYSINQLNFTNVKAVHLEKLVDVRRGRATSRSLSHWTYPQINAQIKSICSELGVLVDEQDSQYRSQRCYDCGWTQKSNRKGKEFVCCGCGSCRDADANGALNHVAGVHPLPVGFWRMNLSRSGFYWTADGVFDSSGQEITVPGVDKSSIVYNVRFVVTVRIMLIVYQ